MVQISEVRGNSRDNRTAAHTHIKGLGLNSHGVAEKQAAGFVGQTTAREVCSGYTRCICDGLLTCFLFLFNRPAESSSI